MDEISLPVGFRFHPTDEELLVHYLLPKTAGVAFSHNVIADVDLCKYDPWELPGMALFNGDEWYFFSPRDRKHPNGSRSNRCGGSGYWKATGTDKTITSVGRKVGVKKALVFYIGKPPNGTRTNWIMHEYRVLFEDNGNTAQNLGTAGLDDWVLCRVYKKRTSGKRSMQCSVQDGAAASSLGGVAFSPLSGVESQLTETHEQREALQNTQSVTGDSVLELADDLLMELPAHLLNGGINGTMFEEEMEVFHYNIDGFSHR